MNQKEFEEEIFQLANKYNDTEKFIAYFEIKRAFSALPPEKKMKFYGTIGVILQKRSFSCLAIACQNIALVCSIKIKDKVGQENCYGNLGNANFDLGSFDQSIDCYTKALKIATELGDKLGESKIFNSLGKAYRSTGNYRKAIEFFEASLWIKLEIGDRLGESKVYLNLGNVYLNLGYSKKVLELYEKSLQIKKEIGDKLGESNCYNNIGIVFRKLRDFKKSIEYYEKALGIIREIGDRSGESKTVMNIGNAYVDLGDFREAIKFHEMALEIAKKIGDRPDESNCYVNLGIAYNHLNDTNRSIEYFKKALEITKQIGQIYQERSIYFHLAKIYSKDNCSFTDYDLAYNYCKCSIDLSEIICEKLIEENQITQFQAGYSSSYELMVTLCLKKGAEIEAFEYVERSKSRAFINLLATTKIKPSVKLTSEIKLLIDDEERCLNDLRAIQIRNLNPTIPPFEIGKMDQVIFKLDQIYNQLEDIDPDYVFLRRAKTLLFKDSLKLISSQRKKTVLIEYYVSNEEIIIFVITSDSKIYVKKVQVSREKLCRDTIEFMEKNFESHFDYTSTIWHNMSHYLIEPVKDFLKENELVYFVPHDVLHYLPLHALELNGEPFIKKYPVMYCASISILKFCQSKGTGKLETCVAFGIDFEDEATLVAGMFPRGLDDNNVYLGKEATKEKVFSNSDNDIMHFSCHGKFNNSDPLSSGIKLSDGFLTAKEIFGIRVNAELVTLSACQTGINIVSRGDELVGLTRAFLYAGTPSVIVSLWSVNSEATQELMLTFYEHLKNGADKATALQEAQKMIMRKYPQKYYWAPFIIVGKC